jgi:hypothetical protein
MIGIIFVVPIAKTNRATRGGERTDYHNSRVTLRILLCSSTDLGQKQFNEEVVCKVIDTNVDFKSITGRSPGHIEGVDAGVGDQEVDLFDVSSAIISSAACWTDFSELRSSFSGQKVVLG